ncbi:hypothetical protein [Nonomuraea sp. NPDC049684]|uniref:hypothetical protein n=1 Tax=Nonomuraea sp. NPDC049684 TaxID=3364356 RepID=UPI003795DA6E
MADKESGNRLGRYLRARRELVSPAQAGLPPGGTRRVPGLRREEVALLAGISPDSLMARHINAAPTGTDATRRSAMSATPINLTKGQYKHLMRIRDNTVITGDVNILWGDLTMRAVFVRLAELGLIRDERDDLVNGYRWHITDAGRAVLDQIAEDKRAGRPART